MQRSLSLVAQKSVFNESQFNFAALSLSALERKYDDVRYSNGVLASLTIGS
jgi:hypothetical protein